MTVFYRCGISKPQQFEGIATEVAGLPAAIASFRANASGLLLPTLKTTVQAVQSGSGTPSPDNVRPITGWSGANVTRAGKNLFDKTAISNNKWLSTTTGLEENASGYCVSDFIKVKGGQSVFIPTSGTSRRWFYDSNKNPKSYLNNSGNQAFTPTEDGYIRVTIQIIGATPVSLDTYQIEIGSTVTPYEPYNGNTYTIQFGNEYYGGELDVTNGVLRVTHQKTKIKDLSWTYQSNYLRFFSASIKNTVLPATSEWDIPNGLMCECYEPHTFNSTDNGHIYIDTIGNIFIKDTAYTDTTAWISTRGEYLIRFPLATPFTIQLTPQQIEQLANDNNVFSDCGEISELEYIQIQTVRRP